MENQTILLGAAGRGEIFDAFVGPFLRIAPWLIEHPLSKRFPPGFRSVRKGDERYGRNGHFSIDVFCWRFQALRYEYPSLACMLTPEEDRLIEEVFRLKEKVSPDVPAETI